MIEFTVCVHERGVCFMGYMHLNRVLVCVCVYRLGKRFLLRHKKVGGEDNCLELLFYFLLAKTEAPFPPNKRASAMSKIVMQESRFWVQKNTCRSPGA